ncbi:MAG: hypothetical protein J0I34_24010 [Pseudonocardia sp.]|uniref:hypothetical protein n=1 Tax=unclassified Pseudonocardia TaxID=2619320 RepID=UPI00086E948F|nr:MULTISPECIES: hypothetical protein [unclassified Pseudonocardia]MBN9111836.1 hypothetical protein [Pseudonocardia sp.]ODU18880.1 MAG: hypothetical protein ABS80_19690 [Pseudonocardia sp. SCN 72-51]ODV06806.1 MAG: hypothetical protein ABT15_11515 [Pseudonocardia sp. SCN 73-27]
MGPSIGPRRRRHPGPPVGRGARRARGTRVGDVNDQHAAASTSAARNVGFTKGFIFWNWDPTADTELELVGITGNYLDDKGLDSGPPVGTIVPHGQTIQSFEVTWLAAKDNQVTAEFQEIHYDGTPTGHYIDVDMNVDAFDTPSHDIASVDGLALVQETDPMISDIT